MAIITKSEFENYFRQLYLPLNMYALRIVGDSDECEDIVQQAFVDVWEKLMEDAEMESMKNYLYTAVRNKCFNRLRSNTSSDTDVEELGEELADTSDDENVMIAERDARLWSVIDELPSERRRIFLMAKRDGMRYSEIADELRISVKTVENQMGKALKSLREVSHRIYMFFFG